MTKLKRVILLTSLISIGRYSFSQSEITTIIIPKNITETSEYTFKQCKSLERERNMIE